MEVSNKKQKRNERKRDYLKLRRFLGNKDVIGIIYGMLDAVDWAMVKIARKPKKVERLPKNDRFLVACVKRDSLQILKWTASKTQCPWSIRVCTVAIEWGRLEILKWLLLEQKCPLDERICEKAAASGQLEVLKWAIEERKYAWDNYNVTKKAAQKGKLNILQWMHNEGHFNEPTAANLCNLISYGGHIECLKWAREQNYQWSWLVTRGAAGKGHLELLKWAVANGCIAYQRLRNFALIRGQHHVVQWAVENNY